MEFLQLLWKFHGYIFNGLGEKWIWKLPPEILPVGPKPGSHTSATIDNRKTKNVIEFL